MVDSGLFSGLDLPSGVGQVEIGRFNSFFLSQISDEEGWGVSVDEAVNRLYFVPTVAGESGEERERGRVGVTAAGMTDIEGTVFLEASKTVGVDTRASSQLFSDV